MHSQLLYSEEGAVPAKAFNSFNPEICAGDVSSLKSTSPIIRGINVNEGNAACEARRGKYRVILKGNIREINVK